MISLKAADRPDRLLEPGVFPGENPL